MRRKVIIGTIAGFAALSAAVSVSIRSRVANEATWQRAALDSIAAPVNIIHPAAVSASDELSLPGDAQAYRDTPVYARTSGYLRSWKVDIGAHVKENDVLAEIETPELDQQLDQAEAELKNAQANLEIAQLTAGRWERLFKKDTVSQQERDQAASDLSAKQALVNSSEANVRRLKNLQAFEKVRAPFDGVITARNTDVGALIQAGDNTAPKELFHIVSAQVLRIYVSVPEIHAASVKPDDLVQVSFAAFPGKEYQGKVVRDAGSIDSHSRTLNVEVDVENPQGSLFSGGYSTVHFRLPATAGSVTIPANTLLFRAEGPRAAVVQNGKAHLIPVRIGHDYGNSVEVVAGLTAKDDVIIDPSDSLSDGDPVVVEAKPADPAKTKT